MKLGEGTYGVVEAISSPYGMIAKKSLKLTDDVQTNIQLKRRFKREVQYQASFNHPNIVKVIESNLDCDSPFFIMPLAICSLGSEQKKGIVVSNQDKIAISSMIINGIKAIHDAGQIHRDIKPQNILRFHSLDNKFYSYAISDFGLVADRNREDTTLLTMTNVPMGTINYISPECYLDASNNSTYKSDIYSLGVLIKFIFDGETGLPMHQRKSKSIFNSIIMKCTEAEPDSRFATIHELHAEFERICKVYGDQSGFITDFIN